MEKNVIVVDEQGNEYEATYPKRAKGLVKKGRARFVEENTICLACPPNENLEDKEMSENTNVNAQETVAEKKNEISLDHIFAEIKAIREQTDYLDVAIKSLHCIESVGPGDVGAAGKADGIAAVVKCRETTNQQLLKFYEKVYDDLLQREEIQVGEKVALVKSAFDNVLAYISDMNLSPEDRFASVGDVTEHISQLLSQILADK